eukprot:4345859-Prymnesium_polylepis.1
MRSDFGAYKGSGHGGDRSRVRCVPLGKTVLSWRVSLPRVLVSVRATLTVDIFNFFDYLYLMTGAKRLGSAQASRHLR